MALCVAGAAAAPFTAYAEDPAPGAAPPTTMDEVIVTGSRIRGSQPVGSEVTSIARDDIEAIAPLSTSSLIQRLPQVFNLGV